VLAYSVLFDAITLLGTYFPAMFIQSGFDVTLGYGISLLVSIGLLLAGYAVLAERKRFGTPGAIYGILSLLSGVMTFFGIGYPQFGIAVTVLLYVLGSYILFQHRKVRA
jgi:hypothetical protein